MSGVEIVGFLLASLPLAISAVEHYRDGLDPLMDYLRYDRTLKALHTRLRLQEILYEGTLQRLLSSELSEAEASFLFQDSKRLVDAEKWGTKEIEEKLHRKLGDQYQTFMDVVKEMESIMTKLMYKLDIDIQGKSKASDVLSGTSQSRRRLEWEWRRIRRSFGRKEREALIQDFERYNANLATYVEQHEILAPSPERWPGSSLTHLDLVRDQVCGLYEALEDGWRCSCLDAHNANLKLGGLNTAKDLPLLKVTFSYYRKSGHPEQCQEAWQEAQVHISEVDKEQMEAFTVNKWNGNNTVSIPPAVPRISVVSDTLPGNGVLSADKTIHPKNVRFLESPSPNIAKDSTLRSTNLSGDFGPRSPINSLCHAVQATQTEPTCLGFLLDRARTRSITFTTIVPQSSLTTPVRLANLLSAKRNLAKQPGKLSRQQRLQIAVTLASSVLQLHNSPWLSENWDKRDIYFFFNGLDSDNRPLISDAYVSRSFWPLGSPEPTNQSAEATTEDFLSSQIINKTLFALGIVLIELCLNKSLEDLRPPSDDKHESARSQSIVDVYRTATSQIDKVYNKGGTQYGYVVQRCLKCEFGIQDSKKQLDFDAFRGLVYEGVVAPLEEDLRKYSLYRGNTI